MSLVFEMPHFDSGPIGVVDLNVEKYPMSPEEKRMMMQKFSKTGLVAQKGHKYLHFRPDHSVAFISRDEYESLPQLPLNWEKYLVTAESRRTPRMTEVFVRR